MQLDDLKPAWNHLKLRYTMQQIEPQEVLSIIEHATQERETKFGRIIFNLLMFMVMIIFCQGG